MTTWTEIDRLDTPTSGAFDFPSLTLTGYEVIQIICSGITVTTDGTDPRLTFYVSAAEVVTGYRRGTQTATSGGSTLDEGTTSDTSIRLVADDAGFDVGNAAGEAFSSIIVVDAPLSTALYKKAEFQSVFTTPAGSAASTSGVGLMENAGAIDGLKIGGTSNLTAGKVRILGLA